MSKIIRFIKARIKEPSTLIGLGLMSFFGPAAVPFLPFIGQEEAAVDPNLINPAENPIGAIVAGVLVLLGTLVKEKGDRR